MTVEFRLLGEVEAAVDGVPVALGFAQLRCLLAVLLVEANHVVSADQLLDRAWRPHRLPRHPRDAVHQRIALVRKALATVPDVAVTTHPAGYRLAVDPHLVDLHRFRALVEQTRRHDDTAVAPFAQALGLWRGDPLAGVTDTAWIASVRTTLLQQRHAVELDLTDIRLRRGQHAALLAELSDRVERHPLDERLAGQFLLALYRSGRQADALARYEQLRRDLADELGVHPSPPLRQLYQQILHAAPELAVPASRATPVPRQLPAPPRLFTGRAAELARLDSLLDDQPETGGAVVISAIGGTGGIGKTWLALHWAHTRLDRFPDGQLHVDLRGFDPAGQPVPLVTAVRGFLDGLGVDPATIPVDPDAQVRLYRSLVAGKRMVIVLDNARDTAHVSPLLPGSPTCTVLVTSRRHLGGLVTTHGAHCVDLDVIPEHEARDLLTRHLGHDRVAAEPKAVDELVACCAGLPLALGIVAARATRHPGFPLAVLADELRERSGRLDALDPGDPQATLRAVLSWSHHALSDAAGIAFGLLSLAPGPDIGLPAAAGLLAQPSGATRALLNELENACLVQQPTPGRYRMHDLVRIYAAECATRRHDPAERDAALRRVLDFYVHLAHAADRRLDSSRPVVRLEARAPGAEPHEPPDLAAAMAWFETEHANLVATQRAALDHGWHLEVWRLAWVSTTFHARRGHREDDLSAWQAAVYAAAHLPGLAAARAHRYLGRAQGELDRHEDASRHLRQALALAERRRDTAEQALAHHQLARAWERREDHRRALEHATRALELCRALGRPAWEANALNGVGWHASRLGDHDTARAHCQAALALHRRHHNTSGEADTLDSLGYIDHHTGHHDRAVDHYRQALTLFRRLGNTYESAATLDRLGHPYAALGRHEQARAVWREAAELYEAHGRDSDAAQVRQRLETLDDRGSR
ncbi:BTAD domain-containing putative transcriptional regulator [Amycolatopsis sp., V23-08]|uniref:BTAD domain-containing putative transcriptional regulator n=1 Tax=Amycolatopsis heterodermiae TaxID=3110235 RepID=A0ABU5R3X3_9PSEU|nr:BTAD domain-containing putative transcriptional regulator [Amycolatopsis sp., V23-08]MEA5360892.1 BTAD domain-containing putative transcriptional regulator [Amycolatopsis sp., V23-08]